LSFSVFFYSINRIVFGGNLSPFFSVAIPDWNKREFVILSTLVAFTIFFGIFPSPILNGLHYSVSTLIFSYQGVANLQPLPVAMLSSIPLVLSNNNSNNKNQYPSSFVQWFVGFCDAESSFYIVKNNIKFRFSITLHRDDLAVLEFLQNSLNCGNIYTYQNKIVFRITKKEEIETILFPIFDTFPLNSTKYFNYEIFKQVFYLKKDKFHKTPEGLSKIQNILNQLNKRRTAEFVQPDSHTIRITPDWLLGFIEGDGCFYLHVNANDYSVKLEMTIRQTFTEKSLMEAIKQFLHPTNLVPLESGLSSILADIALYLFEPKKENINPVYTIVVRDLSYICFILIPLFNTLTFHTKKALDYKDWALAARICFEGKHLLPQGKSLLVDLESRMNNSRLTTHKEYKIVEIDEERIHAVLSAPSLYEFKNGMRYKIGKDVPFRSKGNVYLIDSKGNTQVFKYISECARTLGVSETTVSRYINKDKLLICNNNEYYVKR
jgi:hypothetical protein